MTNKIMVADSCYNKLSALAKELNLAGIQLSSFNTATCPVLNESPELIVLGCTEDNSEICESLKRNPATKDTPVVILEPENPLEVINLGCLGSITGSEDKEYVLNKIRTFLRLSRVQAISRRLHEIIK